MLASLSTDIYVWIIEVAINKYMQIISYTSILACQDVNLVLNLINKP
jgi:hypothetical protein